MIDFNGYQKKRDTLQRRYGLTDDEMIALEQADMWSGNIGKGDHKALRKMDRDERSDARIRAKGLGLGAGTGLGVGYLSGVLAPGPKSAKVLPLVVTPVVGGLIAKGSMYGDRKNRKNLNSALDKLNKHAADDAGTKDTMLVGAGVGGLGGAGLLSNAYHSGDLTGRMTLHHGTSEKNVKSIKEHGLFGTTAENMVNTSALKKNMENAAEAFEAVKQLQESGSILGQTRSLKDSLKDLEREADITKRRYEESLNKAYATRSRLDAMRYAMQSELGGVNSTRKAGVLDSIKAFLKALTGRNVVTLNVPVDEYRRVKNPELIDYPFKDFKKNYIELMKMNNPGNPTPSIGAAKTYNDLADAVVLDTGNVSPKFVRGSEHYRGNSLKEIGEYISRHPKDFARGVGKAGLGAAALAGSGYIAHKALAD